MSERIDKSRISDFLADNMRSRTRLRPTLGNYVDIRILQNRTVITTLSPGMKDVTFFAGRKFGTSLGERTGKVKDLREGIALYAAEMEEKKLGRVEVVEANAERALVRLHESAFVYGLPDIGEIICHFDAGMQSGFLSQLLGKRVISIEMKCIANGDPYCEFEIKVLPAPELAFKEAFEL